jgi:hypothetical protein
MPRAETKQKQKRKRKQRMMTHHAPCFNPLRRVAGASERWGIPSADAQFHQQQEKGIQQRR